MFDISSPRLFGAAPGVDFPTALIAGLEARMAGRPPEAWARITLYVNTRRMQRRLHEILTAGPPRLLPKIRLVTDLADLPQIVPVPPALPALQVKLQLAQLVTRLLDNDPTLAPRSAVFDLAESLAALIEEMHGEGVSPDTLRALDMGEHSAHWARSLAVLNIVTSFFDADPTHLPGNEARLRRVVTTLADTWAKTPPHDPIIVAGSTGSRGATRLFMEAVARLPQGAVILPGYDFDQPDNVWHGLSDALTAEDHPQYRFRVLMDALDLTPPDVQPWTTLAPPAPERNKLISLALRPAPVTDQWRRDGKAMQTEVPAAAAGMTLIEAPSPRFEAAAIALCLREAADNGLTAALISPDRMLTRQVASALDRWSILPDDSAGRPLNQTAPGRFLRHVAGLFGARLRLDACLTLLKHPLTASSPGMRGNHLRFTRELELFLRRSSCAFPTPEALALWVGKSDKNDGRGAWADWVGIHILTPPPASEQPLEDHITAHLALAEILAAGPSVTGSGALWLKKPGETARQAMHKFEQAAPFGGIFSTFDYTTLFTKIISGEEVREETLSHPRIMIWGTLEARVQGADLVILGGLNDGTWPELPTPDPWLNRQMRKEAGLLLPERRVGLSAHDFQQAVAAPRVVLTRSVRSAEAETVPSRWLNRLGNLMRGLGDTGKDAFDQMKKRGDYWLDLASALETPATRVDPAPRPSPCPPVAVRPKELSVTAIARLIRDPYDIYAQRILGLNKLNPLNPTADARLRGNVLHDAFKQVIKVGQHLPTDPEIAHAALLAALEKALEKEVPWPAMAAFWLARFRRSLPAVLNREQMRAAVGIPVLIETKHAIKLTGLDFTLTAKPDRIDELSPGTFAIFDYKSGPPPSEKQVLSFDKQLPLTAAMLERGAFAPLGTGRVEQMTYIGLGAGGKDVDIPLIPKNSETLLPDSTWEGLVQLIRAYNQPTQGYTARRANQSVRFVGDYEHLSRYGEWSEVDTPQKNQKVGQ
ncbi:MAG: ATP-dependent helicase/nuclease subunit B [Paracoccaceae bacterium]|jgi:ATP-dependent helicase/nuclease subunit B